LEYMKNITSFIFRFIVMLFLILFTGICIFAQELNNDTEKDEALKPVRYGPTDPKELAAFLDAIFKKQMEKLQIPGAVFILVKDGDIFFAKGYGYADLEKRITVDPNKTGFHCGSISKLITATAVMQLVEQGQLDLHEDVNEYLKHLKLENNYSKPITLAHLLTHSSGIEQRGIGTGVRDESKLMPLSKYLPDVAVHRVVTPGEVIIYTSIGVTLAGHIVEEVSGVPFAQYIDEHIFQPLKMNSSSFMQPPPSHLAQNLAKGYDYRNGQLQAYIRPYFTTIPPAGNFYSTAEDIAHFMIAHLQSGRYDDAQILNEVTAQEMHRQHFTHHPKLRGRAYGFSEWYENKQRAIFHDGGAQGFNARLFLIPEHNLGFFIAWNSNSLALKWELTSKFLDHYFPPKQKPTLPKPLADIEGKAHRFAGYYREAGYTRYTIEKLTSLLGQVRVIANQDRRLTLFSDKLIQIEPLLFQWDDSDGYVAFQEDNNGDINYMLIGTFAYEKIPWYETVLFQQIIIGIFILIFLSGGIIWPLYHLIRRLRKKSSNASKPIRYAPIFASLISVLNLIFLIALGIILLTMDRWEFVCGVPLRIITLLFIPLLTTALTIVLLIFAVLAWKNKYWGLLERTYYSLITLTCIGFIPFLLYWNLLGFKY